MGFGELALMQDVPRAASIVATEDAVLWDISRESFRALLMGSIVDRRARSDSLLKRMPLLMALGEHTRANISDALESVTFKKGAKIIKQGETAESMFFLSRGAAFASVETAEGMDVRCRDYAPGDHFGELALLRDEPRAASVVAESECACLRLDRGAYKRLTGSELDENVRRVAAAYNPLY
jgi:cAMP-dependent protein kinase regulator